MHTINLNFNKEASYKTIYNLKLIELKTLKLILKLICLTVYFICLNHLL